MDVASSWRSIRALTMLVLSLGIVGCGNADPPPDGGAMTAPPESFHNASEVRRDSDGTVVLVKGDNLSGGIEPHPEYEGLVQEQSYGEMALFFVQHYRSPFRLVDPNSEATITKVQRDDLGYHQVRLSQAYQDIPVLDTEMIVHFNPQSHVYLVQSKFIPTPSGLSVTPALTEDQVVELLAEAAGANVAIGPATLAIFPNEGQIPTLVYTLDVRKSMVDSRRVVVDATNGATLRDVPKVYNTR